MTLSMRDRVNREKGREEGKIYGAISVYRDLKLSDDEILKKIQIKYELSEKEALKYLQEAWVYDIVNERKIRCWKR